MTLQIDYNSQEQFCNRNSFALQIIKIILIECVERKKHQWIRNITFYHCFYQRTKIQEKKQNTSTQHS